MDEIQVKQYEKKLYASTPLSRFDDALDMISLLTVPEVVTKILRESHGVPAQRSKEIVKRISQHANTANLYSRLCLSSEPEISFLPGYYAILNLLKIVSFCGPYRTQFDNHSRWHGATHNFRDKRSRSLLTDEIRVRKGGALALYYKTLTDVEIVKDHKISLERVYRDISCISAEYTYIAGIEDKLMRVKFAADKSGGVLNIEATVEEARNNDWIPYQDTVRPLSFLSGFKKKARETGIFTKTVDITVGETIESMVQDSLKFAFMRWDTNQDCWIVRQK